LDTIEQVLASGTSPPGFAPFLSREGIKYVVERNDLNLTTTGAPPPGEVHQVLAETPGLVEVASFGPYLPRTQTAVGSLPVYDSRSYTHLRPIEIFRVTSSDSVIRTYPLADPIVVSGDAGSLLSLEGANLVTGRATFLAGDPLARNPETAKDATWAITDGNQRRDVGFGAVRDNISYLLGPDQTSASKPTGIPLTYAVVAGTKHQTVEAPIGAASVSASSYGSSTLYAQATQGPYAAFDGNPTTAWVANAAHDSVGQWIEIRFTRPLALSTISVTPLAGSPVQPSIAQVTISTARGSVRRHLPDRAAPARLTVPPGTSRYLRLTIDAVRPASRVSASGLVSGAGITDIHIPGVSFQQNMRVPDDEAGAFVSPERNPSVIVFSRPVSNGNISLGSSATDDPSSARTFAVPKPMATAISGYAVPAPGAALESLLEFYEPSIRLNEQVTASSWLGDLPRFRAENLLDDAGSPWIAGMGDRHPTLTVSWTGARTVDSIVLTPTPEASRPTQIWVAGTTGLPQVVRVPQHGGLIHFAPIVTDSLRIAFVQSAPKVTLSPAYDLNVTLPVGLASLQVPALGAAAVPPPALSFPLVLTCGQGPTINLDGVTVPTTVSATLGDLIDLRPVRISTCSGGVPLSAGTHSVAAPESFGPFQVTSLAFDDPVAVQSSAAGLSSRSARIDQWTAASRAIRVGAGPATYVVIPQNFSDAWVATLGGRTLTAVRVDGWQQGYIVPAGRAGIVRLTMPSDSMFRLGLLLGVAALLVLVLLAALPSRKPKPEAVGPRPAPNFWLLAAGAVVALFLLGGPLALVAVPLLWAARRWGGNLMAVLAFCAFAGAGFVVAWSAGALPSLHTGAFGNPAQIASVVALAAVLSAAAAEVTPRGPRPQTDLMTSRPGADPAAVTRQANDPGPA
jgi:arabinofuranan 3-O-arabinosyltransferase